MLQNFEKSSNMEIIWPKMSLIFFINDIIYVSYVHPGNELVISNRILQSSIIVETLNFRPVQLN